MATLAILAGNDVQSGLTDDLTLLLVRVKDKLNGFYEIWGVFDGGVVSNYGKSIPFHSVIDIPFNEVFSLEDTDNEPEPIG